MRTRRRGATTLEIVTASFLSVLATFTAISVMISGLGTWAKGQGRIIAEGDAQAAVRAISNELREAMSVNFVSGNTIDYRLPLKDDEGNFIVPAVWDGVNRQITWVATGSGIGSVRVTSNDGTYRTICRNVILRDPQSSGFTPQTGGSAYNIFTPGAGSIARQITIMIVTRTNGSRQELVVSRSRETVYLRNVPTLSR